MNVRKAALSLCLVGLVTWATPCSAAPTVTKPTGTKPTVKKIKLWRTDFAQAEKDAKSLDRPMLIHFHAAWCGPCKQMDAEILNSVELARQVENRFIMVKVDSDRHHDLVERFDVQSLPTDIIVEPDGRLIARSEAYQSPSNYLAHIARAEARWTQAQNLRIAKTRAPANTAVPATPFGKAPDAPTPKPNVPKPGNDNIATSKMPDDGGTAAKPSLPSSAAPAGRTVGLDGFSPVSLAVHRKWVKGDARYGAEYKGVVYHMASTDEQAAFNLHPDRYTPRLLGCDPVLLWKTDRAFRGNTQYGAFYNGELFLFVSPESRTEFKAKPERYTRARHVLRPDQIENANLRRAAVETNQATK